MWTIVARLAWGAALIAGGCVAPEEEAEPGAVAQASSDAYCILNAHTDDWTIHFQGPNWLLSSSQGLGPQDLDVRVQHFVQPAISASSTFQLDAAKLSSTVGYNVAGLVEVIGGARRSVPSYAFERLEAYTAYQRTFWEIRDASCNTLLGTGASFRPIGAFFRVVNSSDSRLPDTDVTLVGPIGVGAIPVGPPAGVTAPPPPPPRAGGDAGTGDAGTGDAGTGDAG